MGWSGGAAAECGGDVGLLPIVQRYWATGVPYVRDYPPARNNLPPPLTIRIIPCSLEWLAICSSHFCLYPLSIFVANYLHVFIVILVDHEVVCPLS